MSKVIRAFEKLNKHLQMDLYSAYSEGELERTVFPYKGDLTEGVIYKEEEDTYLVPISSIVAMMSDLADDDDDDDDGSSDDVEVDELDDDDEE